MIRSVFAIALILSACTLDDEPSIQRASLSCDDGQVCVADPIAHCISEQGCTNSAECPIGTRCLLDPDQNSTGADAHRCSIPPAGATNAGALTDGFAVDEFDLKRISADDPFDPAVLSWSAPTDAVAVQCALFSCEPEFRVVGQFGEREIVEIANYRECVLARELYAVNDDDAARNAQLDFRVGELDRFLPEAPASCGDERIPRVSLLNTAPVVTTLSAGCWAYGPSQVVAATRLVPVRVGQAPIMAPIHCLADAGACSENPNETILGVDVCDPDKETEGLNCSLPQSDGFGTCFEACCRQRCLEDSDCSDSDVGETACPEAHTGENSTPPCCFRASGDYLGVCLPDDAKQCGGRRR